MYRLSWWCLMMYHTSLLYISDAYHKWIDVYIYIYIHIHIYKYVYIYIILNLSTFTSPIGTPGRRRPGGCPRGHAFPDPAAQLPTQRQQLRRLRPRAAADAAGLPAGLPASRLPEAQGTAAETTGAADPKGPHVMHMGGTVKLCQTDYPDVYKF